jgi:hypothetical protein
MCYLADVAARRQPVDFARYHQLHRDGKRLIKGWLHRAKTRRGHQDDFEPFIYLWIAFNGWAACVTGEDHDPTWQEALIADPHLNHEFDRLVADSTKTADAARRFAELWPIFRVSKLRESGIDHHSGDHESREAMVRAYLGAGARHFAPRCYLEHDDVPHDWGHTLDALYRVRCNLFHGEKARASENDRLVVARAHATLLAFVEEAELLR